MKLKTGLRQTDCPPAGSRRQYRTISRLVCKYKMLCSIINTGEGKIERSLTKMNQFSSPLLTLSKSSSSSSIIGSGKPSSLALSDDM